MEGNISGSSPLLKNTPIKRLGLSRKRKSSGASERLIGQVQVGVDRSVSFTPPNKIIKANPLDSWGDDVSSTSSSVTNSKVNNSTEVVSPKCEGQSNLYPGKDTDLKNQIELLRKVIYEKEERIRDLKNPSPIDKKKISELENLVVIWKDGCKNAFLHLLKLIKERHSGYVSSKKLLQQLGIYKIILENVNDDSDLSISDGDESENSN